MGRNLPTMLVRFLGTLGRLTWMDISVTVLSSSMTPASGTRSTGETVCNDSHNMMSVEFMAKSRTVSEIRRIQKRLRRL